MHGYNFPHHEALIGKIAKEIGFTHVSLSHELMPMIKLVPRATSACADAYLTPAIRKYIDGFQKGFEGGLGSESVRNEEGSKGARCEFMQSDGGLVDVDIFSGLRAILLGPAGGVVGYALKSYDPETKTPVIGFDMGGMSTDVSRYGINLISTLIGDYGEDVVQFYMRNIQDNAELSVRNLLKDVSKHFKGQDLSAVDYMDDGSPIRLKVTINAEKGEAVFDFEGTGPEVYANTNAPEAVTYSAIIYCLRCLIKEDIPLN